MCMLIEVLKFEVVFIAERPLTSYNIVELKNNAVRGPRSLCAG